MKRIIVSAVLVAASACGASDEAGTGSPRPPAPTSASSAAVDQGSALEGTWRTGPVSENEIETTLRRAGLGTWVERLRDLPPNAAPVESNVFVLDIGDGRWDLSWEPNGARAEPLDYDATYEVEGDTVTVSHEGNFNEYRWSVEGTSLTLTWLDTTYRPHQGVPEEVFQTAFYMTERFERQE